MTYLHGHTRTHSAHVCTHTHVCMHACMHALTHLKLLSSSLSHLLSRACRPRSPSAARCLNPSRNKKKNKQKQHNPKHTHTLSTSLNHNKKTPLPASLLLPLLSNQSWLDQNFLLHCFHWKYENIWQESMKSGSADSE